MIQTDPNRYAIIGSGALGGLYGAMLARAGFEVHFLLHSDYQHVVEHGLRVDSVKGDFHLPHVHAHSTPESMPACDVTIVGLKTTNNHLLPSLLLAPTRGGGSALVLQNGLNVEAESAEVIGADRVMGGCCFLCSNKVGPGHIRHLDYGRIVFGEFDPSRAQDSVRVKKIEGEMQSAGIDARSTDDLPATRWRKLMWNITFNGLSVVLDASTDQLMGDPDACALAESIIAEVYGAAAGCGVSIPDEAKATTLEHTRTMVPYDSSMRLDFLARRPIELEAIVGNPLREAQRHNAAMPRVEMLYRQLKFLDARNRTAVDPG
ncbi:MAG: putative 2-dehydropantoate 2-reductase [Planctomycetota bacterium]